MIHNGVGNQLFVYLYGMIFSNKLNIPYYHQGIPNLNIKPNKSNKKNNYKNKLIKNFIKELNNNNIDKNINYQIEYSVNPTIEDYNIFKPYINYLKSIIPFKKNININNNDLVYHLRAGDYLFISNYIYLNSNKLEQLLKKIKYKNLYVVTNLVKKSPLTFDEYIELRKKYFKYGEHEKPLPINNCIQNNEFHKVIETFNNMINLLNKYNCIWISDSVYEDFNFMRSFNKIIINVSTLSWWAAILSDAEEVYAPKNWRYQKKNNKNLPLIDLKNWHAVDF